MRLDDIERAFEITKMNDKKAVKLTPAAERALKEAKARRAEAQRAAAQPKENPPREDLEPTRYGDWEKKGITSDF